MRALVTGGAGFLGHHLVEHLIKNTSWDIIVLDRLTYASNGLDRLRDISCFNKDRVLILAADFTQPLPDGVLREIGYIDYIFHLGAETHVDKSIENPEPFVLSNVLGTMRMLDLARKIPELKTFFMFSTDEVYGPAPAGINYREGDRYNSTNPYAATKAGAEQLALAYANTYGIPVIITNTMNIFGERQHPEKFIPKVIRKVLNNEIVRIHSDKTRTIPGSRFWIHARNVSEALSFLVKKGIPGERYHIVGEQEIDNLQMAQIIAGIIGMPLKYELVDFHSSRPGHDLRYALDGSKLKSLGMEYPRTFHAALKKTIEWTLQNPKWLKIEDKNELHLLGSAR